MYGTVIDGKQSKHTIGNKFYFYSQCMERKTFVSILSGLSPLCVAFTAADWWAPFRWAMLWQRRGRRLSLSLSHFFQIKPPYSIRDMERASTKGLGKCKKTIDQRRKQEIADVKMPVSVVQQAASKILQTDLFEITLIYIVSTWKSRRTKSINVLSALINPHIKAIS